MEVQEWTVVITLRGSSAMSVRERVSLMTSLENQGWDVKDITQFKGKHKETDCEKEVSIH